ncbi:FKBP-type peptidyl-prolyl cis-trans isomerase [Microbacterium sp. 4R-513]|uniref:FKBP-type peptidyl-prolyl cis-trans isomerase n=1 Tax=Microbacterium sp. 4R-513 TaxID=2567934 RepID=UPI0013E13F7E|nr:FKBP-type peptidyl-prolyl cis-trans isomerase [Microbacterium sp. 4R-513]QIG38183.1 FKBP-type peptidyl-prolyl cis-trans isomerase [Microbacterium sp. 4R-513]
MRTRSLALLSLAAMSALVLAGCTAAPSESESSPSATAAADLCSAQVKSGEASDSVKIDGAVGTESTATFTSPLDVAELQSTLVDEGKGDALASGDLVQFALSAYDASTGEKLGAQGYNDDLLPQQISPDGVLGQVVGCAKPGSRYVAAFPASTDQGTPAQVYIIDVLGTAPSAAWGEPQEPVDGMPTVELDSDDSPTVTLPEGDIPTEFKKATLKKGDGAVVEAGDSVLVQYHGVSWNSGEVFDESWGKQPFTFTVGSGVVQGFSDAVTGETVGSQVIAVLPPSVAYGEGDINESDLKGQTLVFVVDILAVAKAPAQ